MTDTPTAWPRIAIGRRYEQTPGGEIRVYEGFGRIKKVELETGRRNGQVVIDAEHLTRPVQGWCEASSGIWPIVEAAQKAGSRVAYRITLHRRRPKGNEKPIDPAIPIEDLDHQTQCSSFVDFVYVVDGAGDPVDAPPAGWTWEGTAAPATADTTEAPATPAPVATPAPPTPAPPTRAADAQEYFPQDPNGTPVCPLCGKTTIGAGPVRKHQPTQRFAHLNPCLDGSAPASSEPAPSGGEPAGAMPPALPASRPRVQEAKPWERKNTDGSINIGSLAILAVMDMEEIAVRELRTYRAATGKAGAPAIDDIKMLTARLLMAADRAQQMVRSDGHLDRNDHSHKPCRKAVRMALDFYPVPFDGEPDALQAARDQWVCQLADFASELVKAAVSLDR